jgi:nucleoside-diphosphate-sugar epimerase
MGTESSAERVAVTGATSGVGLRLCEVLRAHEVPVTGLVRDPDRGEARQLAALGVDLVRGDLADEPALDRLVCGASVVHHCAAHVGDWGPPEQFVAVNVAGTRRVVEAAARGGARRFVHLSSTAVYGRPDRGQVTETWPVRRSGQSYDDTKVDAERIAFERGKALGLEVAAIRPPVIYGPYDRNFMPRAVKMLRAGRFMLIDGGKAPLNLVWVDHVVDVMIRASSERAAIGEVFNVMDEVDARPPSVREVATAIAEAIGAPPPSRSLPFGVAFTAGTLIHKAFTIAKAESPPPVTPFSVVILTRDVVYDSSKARRLLGWEPKQRALDGVRREAEAFARRATA